jgi:S-adenosylmethionine:tRNA ribosyltransferase-isomerase
MAATLERSEAAAIAFELPPELEAREPPEARGLARDEVRLLVSRRADDSMVHASFRDLPEFLRPDDLLVANDSATVPAALTAVRSDSAEFALHLSTRLDTGAWIVEPRKAAVAAGERVALPGGASATFVGRYRDSQRLWIATLELDDEDVYAYLARHGRAIRYPYVPRDWPIEQYQTVYARVPGSAEMPSAGRPFSERVLEELQRRGIGWATLTLHCGVASLETHESPAEEPFVVPESTAEAVNATRAAGGRVIAVGTTVVRALESAAGDDGVVRAASGWTDLIITPERGVRVVDALLTGFHEPKASHLSMLEAIAGRAHLAAAYRAALAGRYLWHEFGDVHLIL